MQFVVVYSWFAVAPIVCGFSVGSLFCRVVLGVKQINVPSSRCFWMAVTMPFHGHTYLFFVNIRYGCSDTLENNLSYVSSIMG